jgi:hypothetical protein
MKKVLLYAALLALASVTLAAQTVPGSILVNGGKDTVAVRSQQSTTLRKAPPGTPFYSNLTSAYQCGTGQTISEGSPVNELWVQGNTFKSAKTGTTKSITVAIAYVEGTNAATFTLDKDCGGKPCGDGNGKPALCRGHVKNLPTFGQSCTQVEKFKCAVALKKGKPYWLYAQSDDNSWDAWNWNGAGAITRAYTNDNTKDDWTVDGSTQGAYSVQ